jgi:formamidopyrimidine-DNA glycosylase
MPELPEIEFCRRHAETFALRRVITKVFANDAWFLKGATSAPQLQQHLEGAAFEGARRIGKLLLLDTSKGDVLGMRFGMTGTLMVDGVPAVGDLQYSSHRFLDEWNRFSVEFEDGGVLAINDPRRLGGVEFDPDLSRMGVDALDVDVTTFRRLRRGKAAVKTWLMDQAHIAGIGNLMADELLWRVGIDPLRPALSLNDEEITSLGAAISLVVAELVERGGCHRGDIVPERRKDGHCPRDGAALQSQRVNGRTTYWCPQHQV